MFPNLLIQQPYLAGVLHWHRILAGFKSIGIITLLMVLSTISGLRAQIVTNFTPTTGSTGTTVTITGTGFTNVSAVSFNAVNAAYFVSSATTILAQVPAGATTGNVCVTTNVGTGCSAFNFIIGAPVPSISSFSPTSGNIGVNVSITGQNFAGVDSIQFNGVTTTAFTVNSGTNISATVPPGATTGPIRVFATAGNVTSATNFNVLGGSGAPVVTSFAPTSGPIGTSVIITGSNLSAINSVFMGGLSCAITGFTASTITITIPTGASTNVIQLFSGAGGTQTPSTFVVTGASGLCYPSAVALPLTFTTAWQTALAAGGNGYISTINAALNETYSLSLCNTSLDTYIRIYDQAGNLIAQNDDQGPYCTTTSASIDWVCAAAGSYRILITGYPCGALSSNVIVAYKRGTVSLNPTITTFSPTAGFTGTDVTITGTNLSQITGATINGVSAAIFTQTATSLVITVGAGTTTGPINLTYSGGSVSTAPAVFTVSGSCAQVATNAGQIIPGIAWQSLTVPPTTINRYSFTANAGDIYSFSTCNTAGTQNTKLRILDASFNEVAVYEDNGPYCISTKASGDFTTTTSGTYYVLLSLSNCSPLSNPVNFEYKVAATIPTIVSFTPTSGTAGTSVTLIGTNLSGVTSVTINGVVQQLISISSTSLIFTISAGTNTGLIQLNYSGGAVLSTSQLVITTATNCYTSTTLSGTLNPTTSWQTFDMPVGANRRYTINGVVGRVYNFSTCGTTADTKIRIYDLAGTEITSFDDNGPYCATAAASGDYTPVTSGQFYVGISNFDCIPLNMGITVSFKYDAPTNLPSLTSFTPASGPVGTTVTVTGTNLNLVTSASVNGVNNTVNILSATQLSFVVPVGATTGLVRLNYGGGTVSSTTNFVVTASSACFTASILGVTLAPTISWQGIGPIFFAIRRHGFTASAGNIYNFNTCASGVTAPTRIRIFNASGIELAVFSGNGPYCSGNRASGDFTATTSGTHYVVISDVDCNLLSVMTTLQYKYTPVSVAPTLISFTPTSGPVGTTVTVSGTNLTTILSPAVNGTIGTITSQNQNALRFVVGVGSTTGLVSLNYAGGTIFSATPFTITTQTCFVNSILNGTINITTNWQTAMPPAGVIRRYGFNATVGTSYNFSTCNAAGINTTRIRIYNSVGNELAILSANGPYCTGNKASGNFTPTTSGSYFVVLSDADCNVLSQSTGLEFRSQPAGTIPTITAINPLSGPVGTPITITGTNLTSLTGITINGLTQTVNTLTATTATLNVAGGTTTGFINGTYATGTVNTGLIFTVTGALNCFTSSTLQGSLTPTTIWQAQTAALGANVRWSINGVAGATYGFSTCITSGNNDTKIRIYDAAGAELTNFDDNGPYCNSIKASGDYTPATSGVFYVGLSNFDCTALTFATTIEYLAINLPVIPTITAITPNSGPIGSTFTIVGTNLTSLTSLLINGIGQTVNNLTSTSGTVAVLAGTTTGLVTATYSGGSISSGLIYTVTAGTLFCSAAASNRGQVIPTTAVQVVTGNQGRSPYWSFTATAGTSYRFSTCGATIDTKLRIYNATFNEIANNDDNGPACISTAASLDFAPTTTGAYYVLLTSYDCVVLAANTTLFYNATKTFSITSFTPSSGYEYDNVVIRGYGFTGVTAVQFSNGTGLATFTVLNDTTISANVPLGATTGTICLTSATGIVLCTATPFTVLGLPILCNAASYAGRLTMTTTFQALNLNAGFRPAFVFDAVAGTTFSFRTCNSTGTNDTKIRIYNSAGVEVGLNDDNGPYCTGTFASIDWVAPATTIYYVLVTDYDCNLISQTVFFEYKTANTSPSIVSFTPTSGPVGTTVTLTGTNFIGATLARFNNTTAIGLLVVNNTTAIATIAAGSTTGLVTLSTPSGFAQSATNFTVTTPCNLRVGIGGLTATTVQATMTNGTAPYRVLINGNAVDFNLNTFSLNIIPNTRNVIQVTDANNCTAATSFYFVGNVACGSRVRPSTDTVTILSIPTATGISSILFDGAAFPTNSQLYNNGSLVGSTASSGTNPANLNGIVALNNTVAIVRAPIGTAWQGWVTCNSGSLGRTNLGSASATTCNTNLFFNAFPQRYSATAGNIGQAFTPSVAGQAVKLDLDAIRLESGQSLEIYYNTTGTGVPVSTLTGNRAGISRFSWTSTATNGALYVKFVSTTATPLPGIVSRISCVPSAATNNIRIGTLASTTVCAGATINVPINLNGAFTLPLSATIYLSDGTGSFGGQLSIGSISLTTTSGTISASIPNNLVLPANYRIRVQIAAPATTSDTLSLTINPIPAAPTISTPNGASVCAGQVVVIEGPFGATAYLWSGGQNTRQIAVNSGTYSLRITSGNCQSPSSADVVISTLPTPVAGFTQRNDTLFATPLGASYQWLYNNAIIPGSISNFLRAGFNGNYSVIVTQGTCADTSAVQVINALANSFSNTSLMLYPNPAQRQITLVATEAVWQAGKAIVLTNALGQIVRQLPILPTQDATQLIDLTGLAAGTYLVKILGTSTYQKLIIQ